MKRKKKRQTSKSNGEPEEGRGVGRGVCGLESGKRTTFKKLNLQLHIAACIISKKSQERERKC